MYDWFMQEYMFYLGMSSGTFVIRFLVFIVVAFLVFCASSRYHLPLVNAFDEY